MLLQQYLHIFVPSAATKHTWAILRFLYTDFSCIYTRLITFDLWVKHCKRLTIRWSNGPKKLPLPSLLRFVASIKHNKGFYSTVCAPGIGNLIPEMIPKTLISSWHIQNQYTGQILSYILGRMEWSGTWFH